MQAANPGKASTYSRGLWKSVYLVGVSTAAVTYTVPHVYYTGSFPVMPLADGAHAPFEVRGTRRADGSAACCCCYSFSTLRASYPSMRILSVL